MFILAQLFGGAGENRVGKKHECPLFFSSIDSGTGVISGTIASGTSVDSPYSVTVTATDATTDIAVSESFCWYIVPINIVNPGVQSNLDEDSVSLALSGSASYAGCDTFVYSASGLPSGLSVNSSTGVISGTIAGDADASSPYTVTVTYTDETADISASQTTHWYVGTPTTSDFSLATTPNTPITEIDLTQCTGVPDDPTMLTTIVSGPTYGTLAENPDGSYTYTPDTGFTGTDSFTFTVTNGGLSSNVSTATITVADDVPTVYGNLSYADLPGQSLALSDLLGNATDPDGAGLSPQIVSGPSNGTLSLNSAGTEVYTPNAGFTGTDSFTYDVTNGSNTSGTATVCINVASTAILTNTVLAQVGAGGKGAIAPSTLLANAMSASGRTVSLCSFTQPSDGTLSVDPDGDIDYTPNAGFTGTDSFTCFITDGAYSADETVQLQVGSYSFVQAGQPGTRNARAQETLEYYTAITAAARQWRADNNPVAGQVSSAGQAMNLRLLHAYWYPNWGCCGCFQLPVWGGWVDVTVDFRINANGQLEANVPVFAQPGLQGGLTGSAWVVINN